MAAFQLQSGKGYMEKNYFKVLTSIAVAAMMAVSIFTGTAVVNAEDTTTQWTVSKSKTATALDANNETQVTLSLPAAETQLSSDLLFVMDVSSCEKDAEKVIANIVDELDAQIAANGASVKIGFVVFKSQAMVAYPLTDYKTAKKQDIAAIITKNVTDAIAASTFQPHYTNMSAGLACAEETLSADKAVDNSRKHMLLVSDGATYLFCKDSATSASGYDYTSVETRVMDYHGTNLGSIPSMAYSQAGTLSEWNLKYATKEEAALIAARQLAYAQWTASDWTDYLEGIAAANANENMAQYNVDFYGTHDKTMPYTVENNTSFDPITNVEESFYQSHKIYQQMKDEGIDCHAYTTIAEGGKGVAPAFTGFMNYLAGGEAQNILTVGNEVFYMLASGSVYDEMGTGLTNLNDNYAFSFVNDIAKLSLTVDGNSYTAKSVAPANGETAVYEFRSAANETAASYVVHYFAKTNTTKEHIVWDINVPVTELARVQLTYSEKLTTVPTIRGTHTMATNGVTTLNTIDSNDTARQEEFESPTVTYDAIIVSPITPDDPTPTNPTVNPDPRPTTPETPTDTNTNTTTDTTNARPSTPNTGDETNSMLYGEIFAISAAGVVIALLLKRKYSEA